MCIDLAEGGRSVCRNLRGVLPEHVSICRGGLSRPESARRGAPARVAKSCEPSCPLA